MIKLYTVYNLNSSENKKHLRNIFIQKLKELDMKIISHNWFLRLLASQTESNTSTPIYYSVQ